MPNQPKLILAFVGQIASGKGTAVKYLKEKHGAHTYRFSSMLEDVLRRLHLEVNRINLQKISQITRENFGEETLSKALAEDIKNDPAKLIAIDGVRRPDDVKYLRELPGFVLVHIFADMEKRYQRITARREKTDDAMKTFEEFKKDHQREAEQKISDISKKATEEINNNGAKKEIHKQIDQILKKY